MGKSDQTYLNNKFYEDAHKGASSGPIWVAAALSLVAFFYVGTGFFTNVLSYLSEVTKAVWLSPYYPPPQFGYPPGVNSTFATIINLFSSWVPSTIFLGLGIWFVQKHLRKRPLKKLITTANQFRWKRMIAAIIVFLFLTAIFWFLKSVWNSNNRSLLELSESPQFAALGIEWIGITKTFLIGLPFILLFVPIDAALQEVTFRGFGDQALTKYAPTQIIAFCISGGLFALWHFGNAEMYSGFVPYFTSLFLFGILMSVLTSMDGGLEAAIGIHIATNLLFYVVVGMDGLGIATTWLFTSGLPKFTFAILAYNFAFYFLIAFILAHWRFGLEDE